MITYRILQPEEWSRVDPLVNGQGPIPSPEISTAVVAEDEGEVVGVLFVQMVFHMEPLAIHPDYTGKVSFKRMQEILEEQVGAAPYYAFSDSPVVGKMCKHVGMKQLPYQVWFKEAE